MEEDELYHYGVLGMKWGVRKNPERAYSKATEKSQALYARTQDLSKKADSQSNKARKARSRYIRATNKAASATTDAEREASAKRIAKTARNVVKADRRYAKADYLYKSSLAKSVQWDQFAKKELSKVDAVDVSTGKRYADEYKMLSADRFYNVAIMRI